MIKLFLLSPQCLSASQDNFIILYYIFLLSFYSYISLTFNDEQKVINFFVIHHLVFFFLFFCVWITTLSEYCLCLSIYFIIYNAHFITNYFCYWIIYINKCAPMNWHNFFPETIIFLIVYFVKAKSLDANWNYLFLSLKVIWNDKSGKKGCVHIIIFNCQISNIFSCIWF